MTNYLTNDLKIKHTQANIRPGHGSVLSMTASVGAQCWSPCCLLALMPGLWSRAIVAACNYTKVWAARGHGRYWAATTHYHPGQT